VADRERTSDWREHGERRYLYTRKTALPFPVKRTDGALASSNGQVYCLCRHLSLRPGRVGLCLACTSLIVRSTPATLYLSSPIILQIHMACCTLETATCILDTSYKPGFTCLKYMLSIGLILRNRSLISPFQFPPSGGPTIFFTSLSSHAPSQIKSP
jgi:hypothetical protein